MSKLFLINQPVSSLETFKTYCLGLDSGDGLLFLEDGVVSLVNKKVTAYLESLSEDCAIHCLDDDCRARGLIGAISKTVDMISWQGFVALTVIHEKTVSWF